MEKNAKISSCGKYRYTLSRTFNRDLPLVNFVMLNPSTADARKDDATIQRRIKFAGAWGYGGIRVTNLFSYRTPSPEELFSQADDIVGAENDRYLVETAKRCGLCLLAWGNRGAALNRDKEVISLLSPVVEFFCLGRTKKEQPKHPLYVPKVTKPAQFLK